MQDDPAFHSGNIDLCANILPFLSWWWLCGLLTCPWHRHFGGGVVGTGAACDFPDHASSGCWGLRFPQGDARPSQGFASVGGSGWYFKQDYKFRTQSVMPFSSGRLPAVVELLLSIVHMCQDFP